MTMRHNHQRLDERLDHFVDGVADVFRRVVGDFSLQAARQIFLDGNHFLAHAFDDVERVRVRQRPDAHEDRVLAAETDFGVVIFRAERNVGDVAQAHERAAGLADDEIFEFLDRAQIGVRRQIDLDERTFRVADGGEKIIRRELFADLIRADVERREPVGFQPDAHRKSASAQNVRALHAFERGQARLHDAHEIIRDLVRLQNVRRETQIAPGELRIGGLDVDDRHFGFRRQIVADLIYLRIDFRKRLVRVVI